MIIIINSTSCGADTSALKAAEDSDPILRLAEVLEDEGLRKTRQTSIRPVPSPPNAEGLPLFDQKVEHVGGGGSNSPEVLLLCGFCVHNQSHMASSLEM